MDLLKIACLLRTADVCHVDASRAPAFLMSIRGPRGDSEDHWTFQGKLLQPSRADDRILYSAGSSFTVEQASAWWLCHETLNGIDSELRAADATLADTGRQRFAARSVAYINDLEALRRYIPTAGWIPVDTRLHVTDLPGLFVNLAGASFTVTVSPCQSES